MLARWETLSPPERAALDKNFSEQIALNLIDHLPTRQMAELRNASHDFAERYSGLADAMKSWTP